MNERDHLEDTRTNERIILILIFIPGSLPYSQEHYSLSRATWIQATFIIPFIFFYVNKFSLSVQFRVRKIGWPLWKIWGVKVVNIKISWQEEKFRRLWRTYLHLQSRVHGVRRRKTSLSVLLPTDHATGRKILLNCFEALPQNFSINFVMSVRPHGITRLPKDGFSRNLIFDDFSKICWENSSTVTYWMQVWSVSWPCPLTPQQ